LDWWRSLFKYNSVEKEKKMNNLIKLLYSLLIGIVAMGIAKLVHPVWSINSLLIFGSIVFAVTFILTLLIKRKKR
jgi:hypothetical protein